MAKKIVRIEESNEEGRPTREFLREMYPFGESPTGGGSGEGLSQEQLNKLNQAIQKTDSDDILLANGETLSKEDLKGESGLSAYQIAVKNGYTGTETEWLDTLYSNYTNGLKYNDDFDI